jgi:hypothetical protein
MTDADPRAREKFRRVVAIVGSVEHAGTPYRVHIASTQVPRHAWPHMPQFIGSEVMSTQAP